MDFSPLFIGESSSTPGYAVYRWQGIRFQSPLHRGVEFNEEWKKRSIRVVVHFSPLFIGESSSTFFYSFNIQFQNEYFSPPSIGESSSTRYNVTSRSVLLWISVPSSSGSRVQRRAMPYTDGKGYDFSPLFIGESSSTKNGRNGLFVWLCISVPSSSGSRVQHFFTALISNSKTNISVPSSSGSRVQLGIT